MKISVDPMQRSDKCKGTRYQEWLDEAGNVDEGSGEQGRVWILFSVQREAIGRVLSRG